MALGDEEDRGDDDNEMGDYLPYVNLGTDVMAQSLLLGYEDTCILMLDNSIKCWFDDDVNIFCNLCSLNRGRGTEGSLYSSILT